jgi:hypothetical protein
MVQRSTAMQDVKKVGWDDASLQSKYFLLLSNEKSFQKLKTENKRKNVKVWNLEGTVTVFTVSDVKEKLALSRERKKVLPNSKGITGKITKNTTNLVGQI